MKCRRFDGNFEWLGSMDSNDRVRFFDARPRDCFSFNQIEMQPDCGLSFSGGPGELGVSLAGVHIANVEKGACVENRQVNAIAWRYVANIEVATPLALAIQTGRHLAVRRHSKRSDERRDRP